MIDYITKNTFFLLMFHILLGIVIVQYNFLGTLWAYFVFLIGIILTIKTRNLYGIAHIIAGYILGQEVVLRMVDAKILYEFGKYSVSVLLLLGLILENQRRSKPYIILAYFYFLIPSIILIPFYDFNTWRMAISFNLSGPLALTVSCYYFYRRRFNINQVKALFILIICPIATMMMIIVLRMPSLDSLRFLEESMHSLSGNFGPNQVSTVLGLGVVIIFFSKILKLKLLKNSIYDYLFGSIFILQGLLTFSRGGIFSALLSLIMVYIFSLGYLSRIKMLFVQFSVIVILYIVWNISMEISEGMIAKRYYTPVHLNRLDFIVLDIQTFKENFLMGVGPGMSDAIREQYFYKTSSHTEFTRLLSEHGFLGLISLFIMVFLPIRQFFIIRDLKSRMFIIVFIIVSFSTMMHAAMRLVLPAFIYGFALSDFRDKTT